MRERAGSRPLLSVVIVLLAVITSQPARARQIAEEGFRPSFPNYADGGTGFTGPWVQGGSNAVASRYRPRTRSLCYPRLDYAGGSVAGETFPGINGVVRTLTKPLGADNTTAYMSVLLQADGAFTDFFEGFFGVTLNGGLGTDLFIGKPSGGTFEQWVLETRGGGGQVSSGVSAITSQTALLVVKAQFFAGNDVYTLYVDPNVQEPEPSSTVVKSDLDLGSVPGIGIYSTGAFIVDEIRIGTTFADVVPTGGLPDVDSPGCL